MNCFLVSMMCVALVQFCVETQSKLALETGKSEKLQGDVESMSKKLEG